LVSLLQVFEKKRLRFLAADVLSRIKQVHLYPSIFSLCLSLFKIVQATTRVINRAL
jgi:hypothetical protein